MRPTPSPPRVCIVTRSDLFPTHHGAAVKIVRTAEHLSRQAGTCCVVTDDRDGYLRFEGGRLARVPFRPRFRAAEEWPPLPRLGRLAERLVRRLGYPEEEVFLYRPLFDPAWWARAVEVGHRERIDVFQAEFPGYGVAAWVAARVLGVRSSIVQHNVEWDRLAEFGYEVRRIRLVERAVLRLVDDVVAVSADDRRRMVEAGVDPARITVIPHGVDVEAFADARADGVRLRHGVDPAAPLLFFHGTLHYWPNTEAVRFIAESLLPRLAPRWPDLRVMVTGQNPPRYYRHPAIVFTGPVDDLPAHVAAADLCLCPVEAGGGTRMKLLEYMAAGKAVVSTPKGAEGIPFAPGRHMALADGPDAFAAEVDRLLRDPAARGELGQAARAFARRYDWPEIARAYRRLYTGQAADPRPLTLLLLLNRGCNLRCAFCDLWEGHERLPFARVGPLLDDAVAIGTRVLVLTGGEPFLHRDLFRVVEAARARGLAVNVTTNGTLVDARWDELVRSGLDSLSISLDGLEATHDALRGRPGSWRQAVDALDRVLDAGIPASVYFTATRRNVDELAAVFDLVRARGAAFDFWPVNDAPDLYLVTPADRAAWHRALDHVCARDPAIARRRHYYEVGLDYHAGALGPVRCRGFTDQYGVRYDGGLIPCCVWGKEELVVGNVFERPLRELWQAPEVVAARRRLERAGCTAGCFNHSLYEFEQATGETFRLAGR